MPTAFTPASWRVPGSTKLSRERVRMELLKADAGAPCGAGARRDGGDGPLIEYGAGRRAHCSRACRNLIKLEASLLSLPPDPARRLAALACW